MMPKRPEMVGCRSCNRDFNTRELVTTIHESEIGRCPQCNQELLRQERTKAFQSAAATTALDIGAIESWLIEHAAQGFPFVKRDPATGSTTRDTACWSVQADKKPFAFEVAYSEERRDAVVLRLVALIEPQLLSFDDDKRCKQLTGIAASKGVDLSGISRSFWNPAEATTPPDKHMVVGAGQILRIGTLCEEVFAPVLSRLDGALRDILAAIGSRT